MPLADGAHAPPDGAGVFPLIVESIKLKGATGEAVSIHLSDGSFFVLHAEVFARTGLRADSPIDPETRADLLARSERVLARIRALSLLSRSAQTRRGLARKLQARGFSEQAIHHALARVAELGYLDDRRFADSWLQSRLAARKDGWTALYRGLISRGVARAVAEEVLAEQYPWEEEIAAAREVARGLARESAIRKLAGKGFRSRTIAAVIREIIH